MLELFLYTDKTKVNTRLTDMENIFIICLSVHTVPGTKQVHIPLMMFWSRSQ